MAFLGEDCKVVVNDVDLSEEAFAVSTPEERDQVDVSTFNPNRARSFLPGVADQTITVSFRQGFGAGGVHQTIQPLYSSGTTFMLFVQPDSDAGTSAANPIFGGTASIYSYNGLEASLNESVDIECTFKAAPGNVFEWGTAWPL